MYIPSEMYKYNHILRVYTLCCIKYVLHHEIHMQEYLQASAQMIPDLFGAQHEYTRDEHGAVRNCSQLAISIKHTYQLIPYNQADRSDMIVSNIYSYVAIYTYLFTDRAVVVSTTCLCLAACLLLLGWFLVLVQMEEQAKVASYSQHANNGGGSSRAGWLLAAGCWLLAPYVAGGSKATPGDDGRISIGKV